MSVRRPISTGLVILGVLAGGLLLPSAHALAAGGDYGYTGSFGVPCVAAPCGDGQLREPEGVAVNDATGAVYVTDMGDSRVEWFKPNPATKAYEYAGQFNNNGTLELRGSVSSIAVDNACYIHDRELEKELKSPLSEAECKAFDPSNGDIYVVGSKGVEKFTPSGEFLVTLSSTKQAAGVTVGTSGSVWANEYGGTITEFDNEVDNVSLTLYYTLSGPNQQGAIGVDSLGNLYWLRFERVYEELNGTFPAHPNVLKLGTANPPSSELLGTVGPCECTVAFAIDPLTNELFADQGSPALSRKELFTYRGSSVAEYGPFGEPYESPPLSQFGSGRLIDGAGIAVSAAGVVYIADAAADDVDVFAPGVGEPPAISGESVSALSASDATLDALVNPNYQETHYYFQYSASAAVAGDGSLSSATQVPAAPGSQLPASYGPMQVEEDLSGALQTGGVYYYQVVASNATKTVYGAVQRFQARPLVGAGEVLAATATSATVRAPLTPGGAADTGSTLWCVQYGSDTGYGLGYVPGHPAEVAPGGSSVSASAVLDGLQPGRTYHYRLVAVNDLGYGSGPSGCGTTGGQETPGPDGTFTTPLPSTPPLASTGPLAAVSQNAATLTGTVDPRGLGTVYEFQVGVDSAYGVEVFAAAGSGSEPQAVSATVGGLQPGTTYHYRLVASNRSGTSYGQDGSFTTPVFPTALLTAPASTVLVPTPPFTAPTSAAGATSKAKRKATRKRAKQRRTKQKRKTKRRSPAAKVRRAAADRRGNGRSR